MRIFGARRKSIGRCTLLFDDALATIISFVQRCVSRKFEPCSNADLESLRNHLHSAYQSVASACDNAESTRQGKDLQVAAYWSHVVWFVRCLETLYDEWMASTILNNICTVLVSTLCEKDEPSNRREE